MSSYWITFIFEWLVAPGFGLIFLAQKGRITRAFSIFFFILSLGFAVAPQYFLIINDSTGTSTELTLRPYPTAIITLALTIHFALITMAAEFLLDDAGRNWYGKPISKQSTV